MQVFNNPQREASIRKVVDVFHIRAWETSQSDMTPLLLRKGSPMR